MNKSRKYDSKWVKDYYNNYGAKEWNRWERSVANQIKLYIHQHYLKKQERKF